MLVAWRIRAPEWRYCAAAAPAPRCFRPPLLPWVFDAWPQVRLCLPLTQALTPYRVLVFTFFGARAFGHVLIEKNFRGRLRLEATIVELPTGECARTTWRLRTRRMRERN